VDGRFGLSFTTSSAVASHQAIKIVAVRSVSAEGLFIEQTLDAATQANLIGMILKAHRPTHLAVPATAQDNDSSGSQPGRDHAKRP